MGWFSRLGPTYFRGVLILLFIKFILKFSRFFIFWKEMDVPEGERICEVTDRPNQNSDEWSVCS